LEEPPASPVELLPPIAATNKKGEATMATQTTERLEVLAKILLRCWVLGFILLLFWFGVCTLCGDLVYGVHGRMFGLTADQLKVIHYCGMGLLKLAVGLFFFIPWVSIRMVLKQASSGG
jgi:hypothetical protein